MGDGVYTEILDGLDEGGRLITGLDLQGPDNDQANRSSLFGPGPAQF